MIQSKWYVSSPRMKLIVDVYNGYIINVSPICRRFIGCQFGTLRDWMRSHGKYKEECLD